jgi:hypothetical protein
MGPRDTPAGAPYDAVMVSAVFTGVPPPGWLPSCAPVGAWSSPSGREATRRFSYSGRQAESLEPLTVLTIASFVSLYGKLGFALRKRDH